MQSGKITHLTIPRKITPQDARVVRWLQIRWFKYNRIKHSGDVSLWSVVKRSKRIFKHKMKHLEVEDISPANGFYVNGSTIRYYIAVPRNVIVEIMHLNRARAKKIFCIINKLAAVQTTGHESMIEKIFAKKQFNPMISHKTFLKTISCMNLTHVTLVTTHAIELLIKHSANHLLRNKTVISYYFAVCGCEKCLKCGTMRYCNAEEFVCVKNMLENDTRLHIVTKVAKCQATKIASSVDDLEFAFIGDMLSFVLRKEPSINTFENYLRNSVLKISLYVSECTFPYAHIFRIENIKERKLRLRDPYLLTCKPTKLGLQHFDELKHAFIGLDSVVVTHILAPVATFIRDLPALKRIGIVAIVSDHIDRVLFAHPSLIELCDCLLLKGNHEVFGMERKLGMKKNNHIGNSIVYEHKNPTYHSQRHVPRNHYVYRVEKVGRLHHDECT